MPLNLPTDYKVWLKGLIAAFIGAAASSLTTLAVGGSWQVALKSAGVMGVVSMANYLKQSPLPTETITVTKTDSTTVSSTKD